MIDAEWLVAGDCCWWPVSIAASRCADLQPPLLMVLTQLLWIHTAP